MLLSKIFLAFVGMVALVAAQGIQETCQSTGVMNDNESFTSAKSDGATYQCRCYSKCRRIVCIRARKPTPAPLSTPEAISGEEGEDEIGGEVPGDSSNDNRPEDSNPIFVPEFIPISTDGQHKVTSDSRSEQCLDFNDRRIDVGHKFNTIGWPRKVCTCEINSTTSRPEVTCKLLTCTSPVPPKRTRTYNYIGGCYDDWSGREYRSGTTFTQTRTFGSSLTGTYSCTCSNHRTHCEVRDVPCCDLESGVHVDLNERFVTYYRGEWRNCQCRRRRMAFGNCQPYNVSQSGGSSSVIHQRPSGGSTGAIRYGNTNRYPLTNPLVSASSVSSCYDQRTSSTYSHGEQFEQDRGSSIWLCECTVSSTRARVSCRYSRGKYGGSSSIIHQRPSGGSTGAIRYGNTNRYPLTNPLVSASSVSSCYDQRTSSTYSHGEQFEQDRGSSIWLCECTVSSTRARVSCRYSRGKYGA